ncbi:hypothetical protein KM043_003691 [Ampulex compressa]|nr:hypothetical protein KM043_003691 [Ampulex compressa]
MKRIDEVAPLSRKKSQAEKRAERSPAEMRDIRGPRKRGCSFVDNVICQFYGVSLNAGENRVAVSLYLPQKKKKREKEKAGKPSLADVASNCGDQVIERGIIDFDRQLEVEIVDFNN